MVCLPISYIRLLFGVLFIKYAVVYLLCMCKDTTAVVTD